MGLIALEGMRFYAYHGFYEEEQIIGNHFVVDVYLQTGLEAAASTDDLYRTINYETVYAIVKIAMQQPVRLLETLVQRIIAGLKHQFDNIREVKVRIKKLNPPVGGPVDHALVETEEDFMGSCGRCKRSFVCYGDEHCWCQQVQVHPKTQDAILQQFRGCLCPSCLKLYAG